MRDHAKAAGERCTANISSSIRERSVAKDANRQCSQPKPATCRSASSTQITDHTDRPAGCYDARAMAAGIRTNRWIEASKRYRRHHPLCAICLSRGVYALGKVVDHILPRDTHPELMWEESN